MLPIDRSAMCTLTECPPGALILAGLSTPDPDLAFASVRPAYYNTMQAGAVIDSIAGLMSNADIPKLLCDEVSALHAPVNP